MTTKVEPTETVSNCSNCGKGITVGAAVLDGNPKHQNMCVECAKTKVEPTVEKWELDRLIDELWSIKFQSMNKDGFDNEVRTLIGLFQAQSLQEAKAERDREFIEIVKKVGSVNESNGRYNACQEILASLKQEEEV